MATQVVLDRFNADIAYADLDSETLGAAQRESAVRQATQLGATWLEFYAAGGVLLGRAQRLPTSLAGLAAAPEPAAKRQVALELFPSEQAVRVGAGGCVS